MTTTRFFVTVFASAMVATPISAAAGQGATITGVVAATAVESRTEVAIAAEMGYRVNRFLGFGVEISSVPVLKPDAAKLRPSTIVDAFGSAAILNAAVPPTISGDHGHATVFTTNVRLELATIGTRLLPYVVGGAGIANVTDNFTIALPVPIPGIPVIIQPEAITQSSTDLALTVGGGASVPMTAHASVDVDVRYLRLIGSRDMNVGRFGVGFSYRF